MATIVNTSQQVRAGIISPPALYSRVVSLSLDMDPTKAARWIKTPKLAADLWLWGITAQLSDIRTAGSTLFTFRIKVAQVKEIDQVTFETLDEILPIWDIHGTLDQWYMQQGSDRMHWDMAMRFTGAPHMFVVYYSASGDNENRLQISFNISEG